MLIWSDVGKNVRIEVSWLDGINRRSLVDEGLNRPISLTIDFSTDRLLWLDSQLFVVESVALNGSARRIELNLRSHSLIGPASMTLYKVSIT